MNWNIMKLYIITSNYIIANYIISKFKDSFTEIKLSVSQKVPKSRDV